MYVLVQYTQAQSLNVRHDSRFNDLSSEGEPYYICHVGRHVNPQGGI